VTSPSKKWTTYETNHTRPWDYLTKYGVTEEEAETIAMKHWARERSEALYRAAQRSVEEAKDIAYARMSNLEKLMYRWERLVRQYNREANC
jgi:replicative superfamily II helicase